ncbi:MAG TPA: o-succinylbenzoate synthase [Acidobacteriaceae bacterium]|nr:o-succinylbenzoate synthase [Acidobacteriaceae bacterium]
MKIEAITARELSMRLIKPFETSFGVTHNRRILLIQLHTDEGSGWGELSAGERPFYNSETTDTGWIIIEKFIAPMLLGKTIKNAEEALRLMAPIRGHEMAKAALENAVWDVLARSQSVSLSNLLGGTRKEISCGVSLGIQADTGVLLSAIAKELSAGYQRIKLKIKPGKDIAVLRAVREKYPDINLTVDANSAYSLDDVPLLRQLEEFNLTYIEQPLRWNDIYQHSLLQRQLATPICLDESIHSLEDAETAIALNACRIINIKLGRVSGHTEARKIQAFALQNGIPVWCGGMLESGIGRAHNIAMSSLPGFIFPGDVSASKRYWEEDIIEPEVEVSNKGIITVPTAPGIGYAVKQKKIEQLTVHQEYWPAAQAVAVR